MKPDPLDEAINAARGVAPEEAPAAEAPAEPAEVAQEVELPQHWSEEDRAKWGAVPAEHRALLMDARKSIEAGFNTKSEKLSDKARFWKDIKKSFAPLDPLLRQTGATKLQTIRNLVGNYVGLVQQPDAAFEHLARSFAATRSDQERQAILSRFARGLGVQQGASPQVQAQTEYLDPVAGQKIARLEQALQHIGQSIQQTALTEKQRAIAQAEQVIQTFAAANPHFNEVRADVEILLGSSKVPAHLPAPERLAKAYEIACRMNPEVWEKIDAAKKAEKAKADAEKRKAEVEKAKVAARNPQGQFVAATGGGGKLKLDEIIKEEAGRRSAA